MVSKTSEQDLLFHISPFLRPDCISFPGTINSFVLIVENNLHCNKNLQSMLDNVTEGGELYGKVHR